MDERYWDQLARSYRAQVHNSLLADRDGVIERWLDELASRRKAAVDFGCGVGNYLAALSNRFKLIHALDHSARLLDQARAAHRDLNNIMYRKADPAFDALVKRTFEALAADRELARIYEQWFLRKLPSGRTLGVSMSPQLRQIFEALGQPTE